MFSLCFFLLSEAELRNDDCSLGFDTAKRIVKRLELEHDLSPNILEEVVLTTSREFYMNAESGNLHTGEMKLAYEW